MELDPGFVKRASGLITPEMRGLITGEGRYIGKIIRGGRRLEDGSVVGGRVIDEFDVPNLVVNEGLNYLLGAALGNQSVITTWYIGLFTGNYTVLATDTAAGIAAAATEATAYTAGVRQTWSPAAPSSQQITNAASQASFTFNGSITVYGGFLISNSVINGTSGKLFSGAQFGASKAVVNTDILLLTYTYTAASA